MNDKKTAVYLFLFSLTIFYLTSSLRIDSGDGETMYRVACSLVSGQGFAIPVEPISEVEDVFGSQGKAVPLEIFMGGDGYGLYGVDGRYYAKYGLGWSLLAAPFCAMGKVAAMLTPVLSEAYASRAMVMLLNPLLTAGACALLFCLARRYYAITISITIAFMYGFCTIAWYYAKSAFSEPLVAILLVASLLFLENRAYLWTGIALGLMLLTRQTAIFLIIPILVFSVWRGVRQRSPNFFSKTALLIIPILIAQLGVWGYNAYRFGNINTSGYENVAWDTPLFLGLYSQLFSPGKGLFIFSPVLILGLWGIFLGRDQKFVWISAAICLVYLIPLSLYRDWDGGGGWGPRLLLPVIPILLLPAGFSIQVFKNSTPGRLILLVVITLSLYIQMMGVSANWSRHLHRVYYDSFSGREYYHRVHYHWSDSPIIGQFLSTLEAFSISYRSETREELFGYVEKEQMDNAENWQVSAVGFLSHNVPDFWFVYFWYLHLPPFWITLPITGFAGLAVCSGLVLRKSSVNNEAVILAEV